MTSNNTDQTTPNRSTPPRTRAGKPVKYEAVADALRQQISTGALPPGALLPAEPELTNQHGVSRATVRNAIAALRAEGLVAVHHGRGTFVRPTGTRPARTEHRTTTTEATQSPVEPPATYRTNATPDLALTLGLTEHAPLFVCDRLTEDHAGRRTSHRLYVPFAVCADVPALENDPFRDPTDLYTALTDAGHQLHHTEYVQARMPTPDDTTTLHIPDATPLLIIRRTTTNTHGRVLALEETRLSADNTQLAYQLPTADG